MKTVVVLAHQLELQDFKGLPYIREGKFLIAKSTLMKAIEDKDTIVVLKEFRFISEQMKEFFILNQPLLNRVKVEL